MSKFIEPPYEKIDHSRYSHLKNVAINIENVDGIKKDRYHVYPDNTGIPILVFLGTKNNSETDVIPIKWCFNSISDMEHIYKGLISGNYDWFKDM